MAEAGPSRLAPPQPDRDHPLSASHPSHPRLARASSSSSLYRVLSPQSPRSEAPPNVSDAGTTPRVRARQVERLHPSAERRHIRTGSTPIRLVDADLLGTRAARKSSKDDVPPEAPSGRSRGDSTARTVARFLDGYTEAEMEVIGTRYDLMDDEEVAAMLAGHGASTPELSTVDEPMGTLETPKAKRTAKSDAFVSSDEERPNEDGSRDPSTSSTPPLFPPSPPPNTRKPLAHPLRILSRAIRDLEDKVAQLVLDNEALQAELTQSPGERSKQNAIHDDIFEALGTSLTSPSPLRPTTSHPVPDTAGRPVSPTPTTKSVPPPSRAKSPVSVHQPDPSRPGSTVATSKASKATWTSNLWGWNGAKRSSVQGGNGKAEGRRRGSGGSISSHMTKASAAETKVLPEDAILDEVDEEVWRKGDGGSTPAIRAIVNATRILSPDPSSILVSSSIPSNSLIAYLAHSLVSNARDEGLVARDANQRRSSKSRSRAASTVSQESQRPRSIEPDTASTEVTKGYGDQALAVGRSLLSSVSNATIRGTKAISSMTEETPKTNLAQTTSRPFLSSTAPPHDLDGKISGTTSPHTEAPPPSVELASIIPDEARPPTMLLSRQNLGSFFRSSELGRVKLNTASRFKGKEPPLTDRYGFIYDIQHAKLLKDASDAGAAAPASLNGTIPASQPERLDRRQARKRDVASLTPDQTPSRESAKSPGLSSSAVSTGTSTPRSEASEGHPEKPHTNKTSELSNRHRSLSTVAALNPSPAKPSLAKDHLTVSVRGSTSLGATPELSSSKSSPLTTSASLAELPSDHTTDPSASRATISSLLDQLTEVHDRQQKERMAEWDSFLAHRAKVRITAVENRKGSAEMTWGSGLVGFDELQGKKGDQEDKKTFARLVRRGIPLVYRNDIWAECSGARDMKVPGEYTEILKAHAGEPSPVQAEIEKDVTRTFPGNMFFGGDGPGVPKLRNVLTAYSWHNPAIGYCQGMNMLAATLLLTHSDEEQAYWTLVAMIDRLLPPSFFSPDLEASRVDQMGLEDLVEHYAPKIHDKLVELGIDLASLTFGWFLSLFTDCLPVETLFRIWDLFFVEGHDVLFRVSLAVLKLNEPFILSTESVSDLFTVISGTTSRLWAADKLVALQHSYKSVIKHGDIQAKFDKHLEELRGTAE